MNVIFVGFMGSGKTTLARIVSRKHCMRFVDMDKLIEKREGLTITEIFDKKGESYFRELERELILNRLVYCDNSVIATGGGTPCFFDNMDRLKAIGWVVHLKVDFDTVLDRVKTNSKRPLFNDLGEAKALFLRRQKCYAEADLQINANLPKGDVLLEIERFLFKGI